MDSNNSNLSNSTISNSTISISNVAALKELLDQFPLPTGEHVPYFRYGTAGFRYPATLLESTMIRMGMLAALRSKYHYHNHNHQSNQTNANAISTIGSNGNGTHHMGLMVTASHNAEPDNGIKLADAPYGRMLDDATWEAYAVQLCNSKTSEECVDILDTIITCTMGGEDSEDRAVVHVGRDTRSHSAKLCALAVQGAMAISNTKVVDHGVVTTPILHHFVLCANGKQYLSPTFKVPEDHGGGGSGGRPSPSLTNNAESYYYHTMAQSYLQLLHTKIETTTTSISAAAAAPPLTLPPPSPTKLVVDCACGVAAPCIAKLQSNKSNHYSPPEAIIMMGATKLQVVNGVGDGPLNHDCGAEYVQKQQLPPKLYRNGAIDILAKQMPGERWCSFDGDGDRLVFHYVDRRNTTNMATTNNTKTQTQLTSKFCLLDGDKIAVLMGQFIRRELDLVENAMREFDSSYEPIKFGVVQTAYANGNSTAYLRVSANCMSQCTCI
jgi:phosphoacetylglucosamine mutase